MLVQFGARGGLADSDARFAPGLAPDETFRHVPAHEIQLPAAKVFHRHSASTGMLPLWLCFYDPCLLLRCSLLVVSVARPASAGPACSNQRCILYGVMLVAPASSDLVFR